MSISIITPCYNAERFINATLDSVRAQTCADWEHVLVDDGSTDNTRTVLQAAADKDDRLRCVPQFNQGVAPARNNGLAASDPSRPYVIFFDHDDLWEPDILECLSGALDAHPECVAAYGLPRYMGDAPPAYMSKDVEVTSRERTGMRGSRAVKLGLDEPTTFADLVYINCIPTPGQVLIRRSALEKVGAFDATCEPADDWDMWLRLTRLGPFHLENRVLIHWRMHPNNGSHRQHRVEMACRHVRMKAIRAPENSSEQRRLALLGMRARLADTIGDKLMYAREAATGRNFRGAAKQMTYTVKPFVELLSTYTAVR